MESEISPRRNRVRVDYAKMASGKGTLLMGTDGRTDANNKANGDDGEKVIKENRVDSSVAVESVPCARGAKPNESLQVNSSSAGLQEKTASLEKHVEEESTLLSSRTPRKRIRSVILGRYDEDPDMKGGSAKKGKMINTDSRAKRNASSVHKTEMSSTGKAVAIPQHQIAQNVFKSLVEAATDVFTEFSLPQKWITEAKAKQKAQFKNLPEGNDKSEGKKVLITDDAVSKNSTSAKAPHIAKKKSTPPVTPDLLPVTEKRIRKPPAALREYDLGPRTSAFIQNESSPGTSRPTNKLAVGEKKASVVGDRLGQAVSTNESSVKVKKLLDAKEGKKIEADCKKKEMNVVKYECKRAVATVASTMVKKGGAKNGAAMKQNKMETTRPIISPRHRAKAGFYKAMISSPNGKHLKKNSASVGH